jgi:thiosulfate/3-mercaptopyruvate sulfurtransferase
VEQLVAPALLAAELGAPDLRVLECTVHLRRGPDGFFTESGRPDWEAGHIPGSAFADIPGALSDPDSALPCMAPSVERFARGMEELGVGEGTRVVLYDRVGSHWATRLWWLLRLHGFDDVAVLDGGWGAWTDEGLPVSADPQPAWPEARFVARPRPELRASKDDVVASIGDGATCIVNALGREQHRGDDVGLLRRGHIPGALNVPSGELLDPETGRYLPREQLAERFADVLARPRVITYCGGGIAATNDAFVLALLGRDDAAVYDGSLEEWTRDPALPLELGD